MKLLIIRLFFTLQVGINPVDVQTHLSELGINTSVLTMNLYDPQPWRTFATNHLILNSTTEKQLFILNYLTDSNGSKFSGGRADIGGQVSIMYAIHDTNRDLQVALHEIFHLLGATHSGEECNIMNPQPCEFNITARTKKEIYRQQYHDKNIGKIKFRQLMKEYKNGR